MKHSGKALGIFILLAIFVFTSCASKPKTIVTTPASARISDYKTVMVYATTVLPETSKGVGKLETYIVRYLNKKEFFERVVPASVAPDSATDLRLNAKIVAMKKAGFMAAMFYAGANAVVEVELIDTASGNLIAAFETQGAGSRKMSADVLWEIAVHIVKFIEQHL